jgi:hypothetical protein
VGKVYFFELFCCSRKAILFCNPLLQSSSAILTGGASTILNHFLRKMGNAQQQVEQVQTGVNEDYELVDQRTANFDGNDGGDAKQNG